MTGADSEPAVPKRNRVTPFGEIVAVAARGTLMGNRGVLHTPAGELRRAWHLRRWILCALAFKNRKRRIMAPGRYTELFFLDEATGLAAGHRPCAECQRRRFEAFRAAWVIADGAGAEGPSAEAIDARLHAQRVDPAGEKVTFAADLDDVPDGAFVRTAGSAEADLVWRGELLVWSPAGYGGRRPKPKAEPVSVLTPRGTVQVLRAGYVPAVHRSAVS